MSKELDPVESSTEVHKDSPADSQVKPAENVLFGTISYKEDAAYEDFLHKMNLSQALFVLVSSANFAQVKGAFNMLESEVLSTAIRVIRKNSTKAEAVSAPESDTN